MRISGFVAEFPWAWTRYSVVGASDLLVQAILGHRRQVIKTSLKIFYKTEKMKKSQGTEEHVPQAADIVEDDTDVDIDKTSFVR